MSTVTVSQEEKKALLHAATIAKMAYWDAMDALERIYVPDGGDIEDKQNDDLVAHVETLAANYPGSVAVQNPAALTEEHVAQMDAIFA